MKNCTLVGIGMGNPALLTQEAIDAIQNAPLVAGAERMLSLVQNLVRGKTFASYESQKIAAAFADYADTNTIPCAVFSGDTGFYSGATSLRALLESDGWQVRTIPGITTAQFFSARLGEPWQDWHLVSAHGTDCNLGIALSYAPKTFFLTGGTITVRTISSFLQEHEPDATLTVGSRLGYETENILVGTPDEILSRTDYDEKLACVLVTRTMPDLPHGAFPDEFFIRNNADEPVVPMTKRFVRAAILSLLSVRDGEVVWDIGAGTGAVSVDIARSAHCAVYAIEEKDHACALIRKNRAKAGASNLEVCSGRAPECLSNLPAPDAAFVGGSEGELLPILRAVYKKNPSARVVTACVTMETLTEIQSAAATLNLEYEATQLSVSQSKRAGAYHLMQVQNPVWLVSLKSV
ncbi:MAG: precorrin-6y C5,15-methyltransferase (decarboxylating) subunit CbiE [Treponema sp.]|nr:precorrin-6y C5,15-methyltransferase (decarboxylating) subunit CbiE [Treponema sp.]